FDFITTIEDLFLTAAICARRVPRRFSGVFIRGFPPNKKTTRQQDKTGVPQAGWVDLRHKSNNAEIRLYT
ncbi:hypothetical protein, partial [Chamaesiphon sp. VAR_48_metabat_135_sub]|uniref:hypothetical protein n=1 Tax=Chamaesiphon sp. VAR_48_metabat_135_sub TaxID=2964699 RepID=UPI00286D222C